MLKMKFCGAAGEVTGSKHIIEFENIKIMLDCGLFQGRRSEAREKNLKFPFKYEDINAVIISHAHIDHTGALPILAKQGYSGPIYCNSITRELSEIMLRDSARLQETDAEFFNKIHEEEKIEPLYGQEDALKAISLFRDRDLPFEISNKIKVSFLNAGHVLGSSQILLEMDGVKVLYSGDLGREKQLLLNPPDFMSRPDYLILETTYGDREHPEISDAQEVLAAIIDTAFKRKSKIIIPGFSLERTQEIIYIIDKLKSAGKIPALPIYVDSPMSCEITKIFNERIFSDNFSNEFRTYADKDKDPFGYEYIRYISEKKDSQKLNETRGPMIIISASGMCEGGRILHHLRNSIENENDILLLVGFQAQNTLGRKLKDGEREVKIFGLKHEVYMEIKTLDFFSAHAGKSDLLAYVKKVNPKKGIFLVHGEESQRAGFAQTLKNEGFSDIFLPSYAQEYELKD
ncbi:MAG: MBL fold metallo-hydrolase [Elusimicrobia bacterium]|nr:MBL fold metallo-hydrolase [Elusimicrobiota bacterium]